MEKGVPGEKPRTCTVDRAHSAGDTHEFGQSTADSGDDSVDGRGTR